ncbi:MAG: ABC transporter ATP-binding protein [Ilumatobacteraceae bacterium]
MNAAKTPAVRAVELEKDYGDAPALHPLDLVIPVGQLVALIGHNGSGKSTFLRMCTGLLTPSGGSVEIVGHAAGSMEARTALSFLGDAPVFYDDLSVWEHLEYVARLHAVDDWEQNAADLLGHLDLYERADDLPIRFSRGLKQKAAIAMAFIRPFDLLLVDEPFVGLDQRGRNALIELVTEHHERGATIVVATHELSFTSRAQRMVILAGGEIVHDGEPDAGVAASHLG